ncbi:MAG: heme NO-binding domain-containing protein [Rhodobacteraceae bacterium]|nr:heme NO-binding domain-containing protein [Paracoccaceae bacterium]
MHGLIGRSIQCFVCDTYGPDVWESICQQADIGIDNFEAMLIYDNALGEAAIASAMRRLDRSRADLLEDVGTYLVAQPEVDTMRRLLRFGGDTFQEFLHSLDDLNDRARLALPELDFPVLELKVHSESSYSLSFRWSVPGFGAMAVGILRAMADDYGALVVLDRVSVVDDFGDSDTISISLLDAEFASGREFDLGAHL